MAAKSKKLKVLVCGATGFIGRNLAEDLARDGRYEVYGTYWRSAPLEYPGIKMIKADLTDKAQVDKVIAGKDIVIQAAATTSGAKEIVSRPYYHVTDNAVMNSLILRSVFENKISHLVFFSCTIMYQSSDRPIKEADFNAAEEMVKSYYGAAWTKVYIEKMCEFYSRISPTKFTVLRHSNVYGPYDKYDLERSHVFGATVTKVMTNKDGKISVWGEGKAERDLLHVSDLVACVKAALEKQQAAFELFNVGSGEAVAVKELVEKMVELSGRDLRIEYDHTKPDLNTKVFLDITKVKRQLGWQPKVTLAEGIKKTLDWYRAQYKGAIA